MGITLEICSSMSFSEYPRSKNHCLRLETCRRKSPSRLQRRFSRRVRLPTPCRDQRPFAYIVDMRTCAHRIHHAFTSSLLCAAVCKELFVQLDTLRQDSVPPERPPPSAAEALDCVHAFSSRNSWTVHPVFFSGYFWHTEGTTRGT